MVSELIHDTKRFLNNYLSCDIDSHIELYYLKAEAKELLDKLNTKTNMKATLMQTEFLWEVEAEDGTTYGAERIVDAQGSEDSIAVWDEFGDQIYSDNPLYSLIIDSIVVETK